MNLLHKKFENFYKKISSPVDNNSNKRQTSTLPASIYQRYETPYDSRTKPDFQSLHLQTFQPNKRKRSGGFSLPRDSIEKILTIRKSKKNSFSTFQALAFNTLFVLVTPLQFPHTRRENHLSLQMSTLRHTTSSCWRLTTFCPHRSLHWYWHLQYPYQFAKCKNRPSSRWPNLLLSHSLRTPQFMRG